MGPIEDECGVEQGGKNSTDFYKVYNNEQLNLAQDSGFGVPIGPVIISGIGQADDVALLSSDIHALQGLLDLSLYYCAKYNVSLSTEKTKLQAFSTKATATEAFLTTATSLLNIEGENIAFSEDAEHVGVLRSVNGNLPHLLSRFVAHRRAMHAILPAGSAKSHRGNPAANLRAHSTYGTPVLFSGIASLVLTSSEVNLLDQHIKVTLQRLQKLRDKTPVCVVMFLGGHLPGKALLHLRLLSIFGMVCRLSGSVIHKIADYQLTTAKPASGSWFLHIRELCLKYNLGSPLSLLHNPQTKEVFKKTMKSKVIDYWETHLRAEAEILRENSLKYFHAGFMSLTRPHPLWSTCGSNPFEIHKAVTQAKMLSGRYVTDQLSRHWTKNKSGACLIPGCSGQHIGSLEHLLLFCPALAEARSGIIKLCVAVSSESDDLRTIILTMLSGQPVVKMMQFILDCSSMPEVIRLTQHSTQETLERLFYISRTWCYTMHRTRMNKLGLFQYR